MKLKDLLKTCETHPLLCSERWCYNTRNKMKAVSEGEEQNKQKREGQKGEHCAITQGGNCEEKTEQILRVHVVWVCLVIFCGMPLSPRLWRAAAVLLQASKTAGLPAALIRGCLLGSGDKLAESVRKCTHYTLQ